MNRGGVDAIGNQLGSQFIGTVLGAAEHQHLLPALRTNQVRQKFALAALVDRMNNLGNRFHGGVAARDFDQRRRMQQAVGEFLDVVGKSRGKQQRLLLFRQQREQFADVVNKTHVEHAVGFVEHQ